MNTEEREERLNTTDSNEQQDDALMCEWCAKGDRPDFLDEDGTLVSVTGRDGILCHAHEEYWWPCLKFGVELHCSRASVPAVEEDALKKLSSRIGDVISESLRSYRCQHTKELPDLENGLPLVDLLTPEPDKDVTRGVEECDLLADYVWSDVDDAIKEFAAAASSPLPAEPLQPTDEQVCKCGLPKNDPIHSYTTEWQQMHTFIPKDAAPAEPEGEQERCIHCDPSFVPTGPDDWCNCRCHDTGEF